MIGRSGKWVWRAGTDRYNGKDLPLSTRIDLRYQSLFHLSG